MAATQGESSLSFPLSVVIETSSIGSGPSGKSEIKCRAWTEKEEEVLLLCLKELVAQGYKSDNGFRPGYIKKLELAMKKAFPGTDLKAEPHINSRIQVWKKDYASLVSILNRSGVGFNLHGDNKVECDNEQWEDIFRVDDNGKRIRKHSWPLFNGWKECFGKDRATGEVAEDVMEAVNTLFHDHNIASQGTKDDKLGEKEKPHAIPTEAEDSSVCQSNKGNSGSSQRKKKRKIDEGTQQMCDLLEQIHRDTNARLENIAARIGISADLGIARKQVHDLIKRIPGLSSKENFIICDKLITSSVRLEFFMGLPEEDRHEYVTHMLSDS